MGDTIEQLTISTAVQDAVNGRVSAYLVDMFTERCGETLEWLDAQVLQTDHGISIVVGLQDVQVRQQQRQQTNKAQEPSTMSDDEIMDNIEALLDDEDIFEAIADTIADAVVGGGE